MLKRKNFSCNNQFFPYKIQLKKLIIVFVKHVQAPCESNIKTVVEEYVS